jgi:hypothetical protein
MSLVGPTASNYRDLHVDGLLARFEAIDLAPGASRVVTFTLTKDDLAPVFEPGDFDVMVGP